MAEKRLYAVKVMVTEDIAELIRSRAQQAGCSQSDLGLDIFCLQLLGCTYGEHVANFRRAALSRKDAEVVQIRA